MPTIAPSVTRERDSGNDTYDWSLANGDSTNFLNGEAYGSAILVASVAMQIEIPNWDESVVRRLPAGQEWWIDPTATEVGVILDFMPRRWRVTNNSGGPGTLTIHLLPRAARSGGAVSAALP